MDKKIKEEFNKIKKAFSLNKKDIIELDKKVEIINKQQQNKENQNNLNLNQNIEIEKLRDEIKFLKKVIYSMQTNTEVDINEKKEIIGNKITLKYHLSSCPFTKKITQENMVIFSNIKDAKKKGYTPCNCIINEK